MKCYRTALWSFMQNHFERRLNAGPVVTFSGDMHDMQPDEGAFVIAVRVFFQLHIPFTASLTVIIYIRTIKVMPTIT